MPALITPERADSAAAILLISELDASLQGVYAPASRHGFSVQQLISEDVEFFVLRDNDEPAGCGGIKFFGSEYAELKRIYVRSQFRGKGLGKMLVEFLIGFAQAQGFSIVRLETGIYQPEAIGLYRAFGYVDIPAFGSYQPDPLSIFMEKTL